MIRNYFWSGSADRARAGVAWEVYCFDRIAGGLNFIDPEDETRALFTKWAILRYRLSQCQPYNKGNWAPSME
jgi:hypothetical protein